MAERRDGTPPIHSASDSDSESFPFGDFTPLDCSGQIESEQRDEKVEDMLSLVDQYCDTDGLSPEAINLLGSIPDGYIPVPHQMGGHKHVNGKPG